MGVTYGSYITATVRNKNQGEEMANGRKELNGANSETEALAWPPALLLLFFFFHDDGVEERDGYPLFVVDALTELGIPVDALHYLLCQ